MLSALLDDHDFLVRESLNKGICICIILEISSLLSKNYPGSRRACVMVERVQRKATLVIIIMHIFSCYFSREHIALS